MAETHANYHAAVAFASFLDQNDFSGAKPFLAEDCHYDYNGSRIAGPDAILASYEANYRSAEKLLDEIVFESRVEPLSDELMRVHYLDRLRKGEHRHEHRCQQELHFVAGKIAKIVHIDLPGEADRLKRFFSGAGIQR